VHGARVLDFHLTPSFLDLAYKHVDALQDVHRLKTAHCTGLAMSVHDILIRPGTDNGGHVPRTKETVDVHFVCRQQCLHGWGQ
jgi:hypothetical protein